jgi:excinuclease UvrABC ATPase subunit
MAHDWIAVRGARVLNLKNVDVDLPRDQLVVLTGLSGSGKSSLAFDTIGSRKNFQHQRNLRTANVSWVDIRCDLCGYG